MTKVLFIVDGYPNNKQSNNIFVKNQVDALRKRGTEAGIMVIDIRSIRRIRRFGIYFSLLDGVPVWFISFPWGAFFEKTGQKLYNILGKILFKHITKVFFPDIIHAHFGGSGITGSLIKTKYNIPLVITEHSSLMLPRNRNEIQKQAFVDAYRNSDKVIAVSSVLAGEITKRGIKNVSIIPNIIPRYYFDFPGQIITSKRKRFISVGNLTSNKRFDLLISAFSRLCKLHETAELVIAGNGPLYKTLLKDVRTLNLEKRIHLIGYVSNSELPQLYRESICFVLPSEYETFGVVYAEAMASGIPVIATECGGPEEIVNSNNGLLIKRNNEEDLFNALCFMYHNHMNYNAIKIAEECYIRYSEETVTDQILNIYHGLHADLHGNSDNKLKSGY